MGPWGACRSSAVAFAIPSEHLQDTAPTRACVLSHVQLFVIPGTVVTRPLCSWSFPGKNTGVGCDLDLPDLALSLQYLPQGSCTLTPALRSSPPDSVPDTQQVLGPRAR